MPFDFHYLSTVSAPRRRDGDYEKFGRQRLSFVGVDDLRYHYLRHYTGAKSNRGGTLGLERFINTKTRISL